MALQVCKKCTTRYAPAAECPHCGAEEWLGELEADAQGAEGGGQSPQPDAPSSPPAGPAAGEDVLTALEAAAESLKRPTA